MARKINILGKLRNSNAVRGISNMKVGNLPIDTYLIRVYY